jgi:hypothetical protein
MFRQLSHLDTVRVSANGAAPGMGQVARLGDLFALGGGSNMAPAYVTQTGLGGMQRMRLDLVNLPISVTSVTTGNGVGGTKIFTFPEGRVYNFFTRGSLVASVAAAKQADFTDATPEGDLGIGTVAPADADALGTDATDDDWGTAAAFTMSSYVSAAVTIPTEAAAWFDGTTTPVSLFVNALVDAADIDDGVTTEILINGWLEIGWMPGGDI